MNGCSEAADWIWTIKARCVDWSYERSSSKSSSVKAPWELLGGRQRFLASKLDLCHGLHPIPTDSLILDIEELMSQNRNTSWFVFNTYRSLSCMEFIVYLVALSISLASPTKTAKKCVHRLFVSGFAHSIDDSRPSLRYYKVHEYWSVIPHLPEPFLLLVICLVT